MAMNTGKTNVSQLQRTGLVTLLAGLGFVLGGSLDVLFEWSWLFLLAGFALLLYALPRLHRHQAPADGAVGLWGSRLFVFGASVVVIVGVIFIIWDAVGEAGEPAWANIVWPIGFFSLLVGFVLFVAGSLKAKVLDPIGLWLVIIGLIGGVVVDMATGAFFEEETTTTEWGLILGIPLAGIGLLWIGYKVWSERSTVGSTTAR
jgi:hypothetical protein